MDLKERYETSQKQRVTEAREIPGQETDFFDRQGTVSDGFVTGKEKGDPTDFREDVITQEYEKKVSELSPPESFDPQQPLHRYNPKNRYGEDGRPRE